MSFISVSISSNSGVFLTITDLTSQIDLFADTGSLPHSRFSRCVTTLKTAVQQTKIQADHPLFVTIGASIFCSVCSRLGGRGGRAWGGDLTFITNMLTNCLHEGKSFQSNNAQTFPHPGWLSPIIQVFGDWRSDAYKCNLDISVALRPRLQGGRVTLLLGLPQQEGYPSTHTFFRFLHDVFTRQVGLLQCQGNPT